jgi:hypothetical protein
VGELKAFLAVGPGSRFIATRGLLADNCDSRAGRILPESVANLVDQRRLLRAHDDKCQQKRRK